MTLAFRKDLGKLKRIVFISILVLGYTFNTVAANITRVEPSFWWIGMKNTELQILIYGENISNSKVAINYPGVKIKEIVSVENPNYLFIYLDITGSAKSGTMNIEFTEGNEKLVQPFELKERNPNPGAMGFTPADVLYLIMPDRFANGNPANDVLDTIRPDRNDPTGRHGGDIAGIVKQLDYLQDLGLTTIWLNPVFENKMPEGSYSGYAITDFYKIDPRLGTNEEYRSMIESIHSKGMKAVMDMIFNHCGKYHWWMEDLPSHDWINSMDKYVQTTHNKWTFMDIYAPQSELDSVVDGWFVPKMPDLNQRNRHLAKYLIQNSIWWIEFSRIDGVRMDTYPYSDYDFMIEWCKRIEEEYPQFNIVGEAWYSQGSGGAWWQRNSAFNDKNTHLKTVMDFELTFVMQNAFGEDMDTPESSKSGLYKIYELLAQDFLYPDPKNILIFLDNHDIARFTRKDEQDLRRYKQAVAFLLTTRGIPQIFYGTEILMTGTKADGNGIIRGDFPGGWEGDPVNAFNESGRTSEQNEAWNYMKKLLHWRKDNKAITEGKLIHYAPYRNECYVYARIKDDRTTLVILNGGDEDEQLVMERYGIVLGTYTKGVDVITGQELDVTTQIKVPARGVFVMDLK